MAWHAIEAILVLWAVVKPTVGAGTLGLLLSVGSVGTVYGRAVYEGPRSRIGVGRAMWGSALMTAWASF